MPKLRSESIYISNSAIYNEARPVVGSRLCAILSPRSAFRREPLHRQPLLGHSPSLLRIPLQESCPHDI